MATITGATSGVTTIPQNSSANGAIAQNLLNSIGGINGGAQVNGNTLTPSATLTTTGPVVIGVGQSNPANVGPVNLGTLQPNVVAVVINNTSTTTLATSPYGGGDSIVAGNGGLTATDNGYFDVINVGGGTNAVTLNGVGGTFSGDGHNAITLNGGDKGNATTVVGTPGASDTIKATVGSTVKLVYQDQGGAAIINPTAGDVTIVGGNGGTQTVFGGTYVGAGGTLVASPFTGSMTVTSGTGYFVGGSKGSNKIETSTVGGSTLVGGGANDTLRSFNTNVVPGLGDVMVAGAGSSTLDASTAVGNDTLFASSGTTSATYMFGSKSASDTFFLGTSTASGVGFTGSFIAMHTAPNTPMDSLNNNVSNTLAVSGGAEFASVYDFITGVDKIAVSSAQGTGTLYTPLSGTGQYLLVTSSGTNIALFTKVVASDIQGIAVTTKYF